MSYAAALFRRCGEIMLHVRHEPTTVLKPTSRALEVRISNFYANLPTFFSTRRSRDACTADNVIIIFRVFFFFSFFFSYLCSRLFRHRENGSHVFFCQSSTQFYDNNKSKMKNLANRFSLIKEKLQN